MVLGGCRSFLLLVTTAIASSTVKQVQLLPNAIAPFTNWVVEFVVSWPGFTLRPYVAQKLQPLLHAGTRSARGLFRTLKLPDSFLIYYQL